MEKIRIGMSASAIRLPDQDGQLVDLGAFRGKNILLSFHPLAWTDVCARQMEGLEASRASFAERNTVAFGVNVDAVPSKRAWAESIGVRETRLLSDFWPHGAVAEALGLFRSEDGFSERASVLIDKEGIVRAVIVHPIGEVPNLHELWEAIDRLNT